MICWVVLLLTGLLEITLFYFTFVGCEGLFFFSKILIVKNEELIKISFLPNLVDINVTLAKKKKKKCLELFISPFQVRQDHDFQRKARIETNRLSLLLEKFATVLNAISHS